MRQVSSLVVYSPRVGDRFQRLYLQRLVCLVMLRRRSISAVLDADFVFCFLKFSVIICVHTLILFIMHLNGNLTNS